MALKTLEEIFEPDIRSTVWVYVDSETGKEQRRSLSDHYKEIAGLCLDETVLQEIVDHFDVARNLLLYSWYVYRFIPVAERHALASLEMALKLKYARFIETNPDERPEKKPRMLKKLLKFAFKQGWLRKTVEWDSAVKKEYAQINIKMLSDITGEAPSPNDNNKEASGKLLLKELLDFRNEYSHGSSMLVTHGFRIIDICRKMINELLATP